MNNSGSDMSAFIRRNDREAYIVSSAHICSVCGVTEFESEIVDRSFWLCPECTKRLFNVLYGQNGD